MSESSRPKRVVMVDAENPLYEVRGEFFWREDHERLLAEAREAGFSDGYAHGWTDASRSSSPRVRISVRRRPRHLILRALFLLAAAAFGLSLVANMLR